MLYTECVVNLWRKVALWFKTELSPNLDYRLSELGEMFRVHKRNRFN